MEDKLFSFGKGLLDFLERLIDSTMFYGYAILDRCIFQRHPCTEAFILASMCPAEHIEKRGKRKIKLLYLETRIIFVTL